MKKFWGVFICLILTLSMCVSFPLLCNDVNAESYTITGISIDIFNEDDTQPIKDTTDNSYHVSFNPNIVRETDPHYKSFVIKSNVSTDPQTSALDQTTINEIMWKINGEALNFNMGAVDTDDYTVQLNGQNIKFTPKLPKTFTIRTTLKEFDSNAITIVSDYATPTQVKISATGNLTQLYEDYSEITLKAVLDFQEYLNPNTNYTFSWFKNSTDETNKLNETADTLVITKDMLELKKIKFFVLLNNSSLKEASIEIEITTNVSYSIKIATTGKLEQTIGKDLEQLNITASLSLNEDDNVPIPANAVLNWYILTPKSNIYQKQSSTNVNYSFNALTMSAGNYSIFARLIINNQEFVSNIINIKINPEEKTAPTLEIKVEKFDNRETGVEGFKFSVDLQDYYKPENIVWLIEGQTQGTGSEITFNPTIANAYKIEVKLLDNNGNIVQSLNWKNIEARSMQATQMWIYILVGSAVLIVICVLSIIISNKKREKIW